MIGSIRGTAEILRDDYKPGDPKHEFIEIQIKETERLNRVVEDFLAMARPQPADSGPATTPVEIISKPNPVYTEEARQLRLQGEVLLEVSFGANGQLHVNRVVRGLGHGLDEAAISAANKMRFKPAQHFNQPVDSTAIVHVVFQLAY